MDEEDRSRRPDIVEEALAALMRQQGPSEAPKAVVENALRAVDELGKARPPSNWKERMLSMWRKEARDGGTGGTGFQPAPRRRRPIGRFAAVAAALVALNAAALIWIHHDLLAKAHQKIRVLSALPASGQVDEADRFVLVFDEPVVAPAAVGKPLERRPYVLSPQPAGQWQWAAADRLEFVLARKLPPGRVFTLKPSVEMEALTGRRVVGPAEFRFQTKALALQSCLLENTDRTSVHFSLHFNQPVHPTDLMKSLSVRDPNSGADLKPACLTQEASERIVLRADRPASGKLKIHLQSGLTGEGGQLPLGGDAFRDLPLPERFTLLRAEAEAPAFGKDVRVDLDFSQTLGGWGDLPSIAISPAMEGNVHSLSPTGSGSILHLSGPFDCGKRYTVTVPATLRSADGRSLGEEQSASFEVPNRAPDLRFAAGRGILSPSGNMLLDLEAVNVHQVGVSASRVHSNNLVTYLRRPRDTEGTSRDLPVKKVSLDLPANTPGKVALDLKGVIDQTTGIYRIEASEADPVRTWSSDTAIVAVTDLGITAKRHKDGYLVWVTSIATAEPVGGVTVRAITYNNQTIAEAQTDEDGTAVLAASFDHPDGPAWVITAEKERDLSFLQLEKGGRYRGEDEESDSADCRASLAASGDSQGESVSQRPRPKTYEVMLYGERGIYRPGEVIHLTGIVRDARGAVPPPFPITVRVTRPDGREVAHLPVAMGFAGQGMLHLDYATPADGQTGEYKFAACLPGSKDSLGSEGVLVEAFVPVRLEVKAAPTQARYEAGEKIEANVSARYLFDQPGAGLPAIIRGAYHATAFSCEKFKDFTFGSPVAGRSRDCEAKGELDDAGKATLEMGPPAHADRGLWRGEMSATVTEPGGRSVSANFSYVLDLDEYHIGLRLPPSRIVPTGAPVKLDWVRVAAGGEPAEEEAALEYELSRVEWDWVVERVNDRPVWKSKERLIPAGKGPIEAAGAQGTLALHCEESGRYRLVVREAPAGLPYGEGRMPSQRAGETPATPQTVVEFYASDARQAAGTLVEQPEKLDVVLDRGQYPPGSVAKVLVRSPFRGTMLLTVETDRVIDRQVLEMADKTVEMELPVPFDLRGGAFVTATVLRAVDPQREKWLPVRASGTARLVTDHSNRTVPLTLDAPAKVRPGRRIHVTARVGCVVNPANPPVVHLWAVDEGILLCTAYRTPAPLGFFLVQRPHEVATADVFDDLMPDYKRPADIRRIGADGGEEVESRRSILPIRTTRAAVAWNKAMPVGADGTLSADLDLPEFTGELRLMAVAVAGDEYGSAQRPITVASPLVVEASWPRFASPGDRFQVPVKLFNNTGDRVTAQLSLRAAGPVSAALASGTVGTSGETERAPLRVAAKQIGGAVGDRGGITAGSTGASPADALDLGRYELLPGKPRTIWLDAQADATGQVSADVIASPVPPAPGELSESRAHAEFTVRPAASLHSITKLIALQAGEGLRLDALDGFLPGTLRRTVEVSGQPNVQLRSAVEELLDYPYGCVEQTSSRLYGILYAPDLLLLDSPRDTRVEEAGRMIRSGILRLWSMQTRNGGLAYWPGGTEDCLWPSAYVGGLLAEARRLGYAVEKEFSDNLCDYLLRTLSGSSHELPDNLRAEICHVLAAFDRPQQGWMNRLSEKVDDLDVAGRAHLAGAFASAGRKDLALKVLPEGTMGLTVPTSTGGRITSQTAQYAMLLSTLMDIQPEHPWVGLLADRLNKGRAATGRWGTTLENAMCIAALAKYQTARNQKSEFTGSLKIEGGETFAFDSNRPARIKVAGDKPLAVETAGSGPVYLHVKAEGLAKEPPKPYDRGLEVRRRWTDLSGREIDPAKVRVGDLVVAEVYFRAPGLPESSTVENVAIVDALPGGVEVENTRLAVSAKLAPPAAVSPIASQQGRPVGTASQPGAATRGATGASGPASAPAPLWELPDALLSAEHTEADRVEWLDDRVVVFTSVTSRPRVCRYLLRATCSGTFRLPQLQASCMYDPAFACLSGGGEVVVGK